MNRTFYLKEEIEEFGLENFIKHHFNGYDFYTTKDDNKRFINPATKKISHEEVWFAIFLEMMGKEYETEPILTIFKETKTHYKTYSATQYKPDFLIKDGKRKIIVEIKGYISKDKQFKYNVYDRRIKELYPDYEYYIVKWAGSHKKRTMQPYLYKQSPASMRINNFNTLVLQKEM